jgi:hypothetical protein
MAVREAQDLLEQEIRSEKAGALARAVERLERALAALAQHDAEVSAGASAGAAQRRRDLLEEAGERLWFVVIQREAIGLRRHEVLYEVLRVPQDVRRAMGPRRRR